MHTDDYGEEISDFEKEIDQVGELQHGHEEGASTDAKLIARSIMALRNTLVETNEMLDSLAEDVRDGFTNINNSMH